MKRITWVLAVAVMAAVAAPALAGSKGEKCSQDAQTCLNHFSAKKSKGWVGIEIDKSESGAQVVKKVVSDGPAEKAGFEIGDVLMTRNGIKLSDYEALKADKSSWNVGSVVVYGVQRGDKEKKLTVTLGALPEDVFAKMVGAHMISDHLVENAMASESTTPAQTTAITKAADAKK